MDTIELLYNFTDCEFDSLAHPFMQGKYLVATNGHVMLLIDKEACPETLYPRSDPYIRYPDVLTALADYKSYPRKVRFAREELDSFKLAFNYPYKYFARDYIGESPLSLHRAFMDGFKIDMRYLMLVEMLMLYFKGDWDCYTSANKREQIVFTNGSVIYAVMPLRPDSD